MSKDGYIKLHRKMVDWEWYDDLNTFKLFIHLLLKVNHKDNKWRGELIKRGTCVTSRASLSLETGLSEQQVRTAIDKLISTKDITKITNKKNTLIIVTNYNIYQESNQETNQQINQEPTNEQPSSNQVVTTNKNDKKEKNDKNDKKKESKKASFDEIVNLFSQNEELKKTIFEFIKMRTLIKKPLTNYSLELLLKSLTKIAQTDDERIGVLNNSIINNWQGIFALKNKEDVVNEVVEDIQEVTKVQPIDNTELNKLLKDLKKGEL